MGLCFDIVSEFLKESKLPQEVHLVTWTTLDRAATAFVQERALHLCITTAIGLVIVIHFL